MDIEARRINSNTYDLFFGKQWSDWIRVRQNRHGVYRVAGMMIDHPTMKELHNILAPNMPITYGQDLATMLHNNLAIGM